MNVIQLSFFIIPLLGILFIPNAFTQEFSVPDWIKNNAGWWASEAIDDNTFVHSMQWLITNDIIVIPPTIIIEKSETTIPNWVKNNAGWWADDLISDSDFVNGIQYNITTTSGSTGGTAVTAVQPSKAVVKSAALTNDVDFIPYIGIEAGDGAAEALNVHYQAISRHVYE